MITEIPKRIKNPTVILDINNAWDSYIHEGRRYYLFACSMPRCAQTFSVKYNALNGTTGYCFIHSRMDLRPYIRQYKALVRGGIGKKNPTYVTLTYEEFLEFVDDPCYYCGDVVQRDKYEYQKRGDRGQYCIDRLDNTKGYTKDNCVACCSLCNRMKHTLSKEVFMEQAMKIAEKIKAVTMV